jgi:hypothetical protein
VARLDSSIADLARRFVLCRQTRMRGVDLDLFDFDYDLTWMGFFLTPDGAVLGRYGGRDAGSAESRVSLAGLRYAMQAALSRFRTHRPAAPRRPTPPRTVDDYPGTRWLAPSSCVRCHQVNDLRRQAEQAARKWRQSALWVYPLPENIGLTLEVDRGDIVGAVAAGSSAARAGLKKGDRLVQVNGLPVASFADVQYALHRGPARGAIAVLWQRGQHPHRAALTLADGWRKTDLSWRWSLRGLDPPPWVHGEDLSVQEKKALGLSPTRLALRQGPFVSEPARQAGIRQGDVILGAGGQLLSMTSRQFAIHIRLNYKPGDRTTYHLLRAGKRLDVTITLRGRR